jgi:hypothetical protein
MQTGYHGPKSFAGKILPASDCAPRILSHFPANLMIPIDHGGGGVTVFRKRNAPTNRLAGTKCKIRGNGKVKVKSGGQRLP